jgi:hypothetical protein
MPLSGHTHKTGLQMPLTAEHSKLISWTDNTGIFV